MQITVDIPDEIAQDLLRNGHEPAREILELSVVSALREGRIYESQAVILLGLETRFELWDWLKHVDPHGGYDTVEEVEAALMRLAQSRVKQAIA